MEIEHYVPQILLCVMPFLRAVGYVSLLSSGHFEPNYLRKPLIDPCIYEHTMWYNFDEYIHYMCINFSIALHSEFFIKINLSDDD